MKKIFFLLSLLFVCTSFQQRSYTWVAIGDSITYLNDHANETGNRVEKGYLSRVQEQLPTLQYINQGHNGWTASRIATEIEKLGLTKADIYSVFLGTNDWWRGIPLGTMADYRNRSGATTVYGSFRVILDKLKTLNPDAKIVLVTPMQRVDFVYIANPKNNAWGSYKDKNGQWLEQFANAVKEIAQEENISMVDLYHNKKLSHKRLVYFKRVKDTATGVYREYPYPDFTGLPFHPDTDEYPYPPSAIHMTYDGLHPSDRGNAVIASALVRVLQKWVR